MFGYIKPYQPELKMGEFEQYRGLYCSLCRTLGKRYGFTAQMTLSYDMTFLVLLHLALAEDCPTFRSARCPYNPLKKRSCCGENAVLDCCADASVLLVYHKLCDTVADGGFFKGTAARAAKLPAARHRRRAAQRMPAWDAAMAAYTQRQAALEAANTASVDAAAEPTAQLLATLCAYVAADEKQRRVLERFGYCLGRWIYLMDAADDLAEDSRTGNYNPLLVNYREGDMTPERLAERRESVRLSLNASLAECRAAYELLTIRRFDGILRNILDWGLPQAQKQVLSGVRRGKIREVNNHEQSV